MVENKDAVWLQLFYNTLAYIDLCHLLKCSIDEKLLSDAIPSFYHQVVYASYDLNTTPKACLTIRIEII